MLSASIASRTDNDKSKLAPITHIFIYVLVSVVLSVLTLLLKPLMIDGDGLTHSTRAIYAGFLEGMDPKHPLAAALLRAIYLPLAAVGLRRFSLTAFVGVSVFSAVGTFLLLACSIFPRFIRG